MKIRRYLKYLSLITPDILVIPVAWLLSLYLAQNLKISSATLIDHATVELPFIVLIQGLFYWLFGLYRGVWRYASIPDFIRIIKAVGSGTLLIAILFLLIRRMDVIPVSAFPLYFFIACGLLGSARLFYRASFEYKKSVINEVKVLIVGAGQGGELLLRDLLRDAERHYNAIGFVDDAHLKQGREIHGVRVIGRIDDIPYLAEKHDIHQVLVAIPSATSSLMRRITTISNKADVSVRTLPGLSGLVKNKVSANLLREVSLEDLLGREPVELDWSGISNSISGKVVLVTGGGGSIGSELCRQIVKYQPHKLVVIEHSELNLYELQMELSRKYPDQAIAYHLISVIDKTAIHHVLSSTRPHIVYHAAAYKHVPLLEDQISVAVNNNVLGTKTVIDAAAEYDVGTFVLVSTDKAVNPTNIMGATKRAAEVYCQSMTPFTKMKIVTVRFGNVLGSAGSVIPLFKRQIEAGGPVTITHPDMIRYFMTIPEACQLILQAALMGSGGDIFVLEMGDPVKIQYLAEQMILLSGHRPNVDIKIEYVGLRPGEKMYEELFHGQEELLNTSFSKILLARSRLMPSADVKEKFDILFSGYKSDDNKLMRALRSIVPEYQPDTRAGASPELACVSGVNAL